MCLRVATTAARHAASALALTVAATISLASAGHAEPADAERIVSSMPVAGSPGGTPLSVEARVDLSDQVMKVYVDDTLTHIFAVSTGRGRYATPTGQWNAGWLAAKWRSRKYNMAPMPWSVFYYKGYAVHGTTDIKRLGQTASHGCVRLHPDNAKIFYKLVQATGKENSLITVAN